MVASTTYVYQVPGETVVSVYCLMFGPVLAICVGREQSWADVLELHRKIK